MALGGGVSPSLNNATNAIVEVVSCHGDDHMLDKGHSTIQVF